MSNSSYTITANWDPEVSVWVATSDDVPGLVAEAPTVEDLLKKLENLIPELLELNQHLLDSKVQSTHKMPQIFLNAQRELQIPLQWQPALRN